MEEDFNPADTGHVDRQKSRADLPPSDSGSQTTWTTTAGTSASTSATTIADTTLAGMTSPTGATRLRFGTPDPPTISIKSSGGTKPDNRSRVEYQNMFAPLRQQGIESSDQGSEAFSSRILKGGSASVASSSRGSRGREPIPLAPEILLLLDRLEVDKGKQARLLTKHLTCQRTLPCTSRSYKYGWKGRQRRRSSGGRQQRRQQLTKQR